MAVKITKRIYNEIYTEGDTDWLLGNVGDWQKVNIETEVAIELFATLEKPVSINSIENSFTISSGERWGELGFDSGMTLSLNFTEERDTTGDGEFDLTTLFQQTFEILNVFDDTMEVDGVINAEGFDNLPTNFGTRRITDVHFFVNRDPEGVKISYGHLTNEDFQNENLNSFIDGSETQFIFPNLQNIIEGEWVNMEAVGMQSGMSIRMARVRKLTQNANDDIYGTLNIPGFEPGDLKISDSNGSDPSWNTARPILCIEGSQVSEIHSVLNQGIIPQSNSNDGDYTDGIFEQAFLRDVPNSRSHELFINVTFRVTDTERLRDDENIVQLVLARYSNGSSMGIAEERVLRTWENCQQLINEPLNYNSVIDVDMNQGDSLVLSVKFNHDRPFNNDDRSIDYAINGGLILLSLPNETFSNNGVKRRYEFEFQYLISSFFDSISNFQDIEAPEYLTGEGSLTDNFNIEFFPEWNNPNVLIKNELQKTARLGNTGWFNENFNELNNDFNVESIEYFDEFGNPIESLDYFGKTKVKAVIDGVLNLNTNTKCGFGFSWIPINEVDYKSKETPFYQNTFIQSGDIESGFGLNEVFAGPFFGAGLGGASMNVENVNFASSNGKIIFQATFDPNASFSNVFDSKDEGDRNFIIWVSVADGEMERQFSDRVSLLVDFGSMLKNTPPAGPYEEITNTFIEHPFELDNPGVSIYEGLIQDDVLCRMPFKIPTDGSELFQRMTFGVEVFNISENTKFDLERYEIDLTSFPIVNGAQQFDIDLIRGFKLEAGNNKNLVKIQRNESNDTSQFFSYLAFYAFKIRWEDWISNPNAPTDFFDSQKENNGLHNDWLDYLRTAGWSINFFIEINSEDDSGELVQYRNQFPFTFKDYDENENIQTTHEYFRDSDNTLLNVGTDPQTGNTLGVILSNEPTRVEITFDILDEGEWDLSNTYGVITIEIDRGPGQLEVRQLSSVWGSESDNPLKPIDGETKLKMEVDQTFKMLKMTCLVDSDLLEDSGRYRVTGRVGCYENAGEVRRLYESKYETKYE